MGLQSRFDAWTIIQLTNWDIYANSKFVKINSTEVFEVFLKQ